MPKTGESRGNAVWEKDMSITFCDLCLREIAAGNRPTTHFNREGWKNLVEAFEAAFGRRYDKTMKNKWDALKKDWKVWKELKQGSTGLGWDERRKTISASDEWWSEKIQAIPNAKKFRYAGIEPELEEKLDQMFSGVVATGSMAYTPNLPASEEPQLQNISDSNDLPDPTGPIDDRAECSRRDSPSLGASGRVKKQKGAAIIRDQISQILNAIHSPPVPTSHVAKSVEAAMQKLCKIPEVFSDMDFYLFCARLLEDETKRAVFINMPLEFCVAYLRHFYDDKDV